MSDLARVRAQIAVPELLSHAQRYLTHREKDLEAAWRNFYDHYSATIRKYAFKCGLTEADMADCLQEVWAELLVRLPTFRLDPARGQFGSWLFRIVRSKATNLHRSNHRSFHADSSALMSATAPDPDPAQAVERAETFARLRDHLASSMSARNLQILELRLVEQRPILEVAEMLGLSSKQVRDRCSRARRQVTLIGARLAAPQDRPAYTT